MCFSESSFFEGFLAIYGCVFKKEGFPRNQTKTMLGVRGLSLSCVLYVHVNQDFVGISLD